MKSLLYLLVLFTSFGYSQKNLFLKPDAVPDCNSMRSGTFVNSQYSEQEYHMVVKDGIQIEYIENGQYIKSKMEFLSECEYKSTIIEVTIPDYFAKPGDSLTTRILETQSNYIKIKSVMFGKEYDFIYKKIK